MLLFNWLSIKSQHPPFSPITQFETRMSKIMIYDRMPIDIENNQKQKKFIDRHVHRKYRQFSMKLHENVSLWIQKLKKDQKYSERSEILTFS